MGAATQLRPVGRALRPALVAVPSLPETGPVARVGVERASFADNLTNWLWLVGRGETTYHPTLRRFPHVLRGVPHPHAVGFIIRAGTYHLLDGTIEEGPDFLPVGRCAVVVVPTIKCIVRSTVILPALKKTRDGPRIAAKIEGIGPQVDLRVVQQLRRPVLRGVKLGAIGYMKSEGVVLLAQYVSGIVQKPIHDDTDVLAVRVVAFVPVGDAHDFRLHDQALGSQPAGYQQAQGRKNYAR